MDTRSREIVELQQKELLELTEGAAKPVRPRFPLRTLDDSVIEFKRKLTEAEKVRGKVSRNAPCPCGSGRKLKHCCLKKS